MVECALTIFHVDYSNLQTSGGIVHRDDSIHVIVTNVLDLLFANKYMCPDLQKQDIIAQA